jgi:hypothetical protein
MSDVPMTKFEEAARDRADRGTLRDLWDFIIQNRKWWMIPIIVTLLVFSALVFLSATGVAPFIYTLF